MFSLTRTANKHGYEMLKTNKNRARSFYDHNQSGEWLVFKYIFSFFFSLSSFFFAAVSLVKEFRIYATIIRQFSSTISSQYLSSIHDMKSTIFQLVLELTEFTSLHPGLSVSSHLLACNGWPALTGINTTLSPITT